ncbi:glycine cleavage system protein R [Pleionea sediminis]|uniref:glycine cleavage system protein R n=1 Tax=Pleionea sediminis TaxID=2569479 RepID=UPI001186CCA5|nr:ACT domain-containing protein [Pleionea sediminis]
MSARLVISAIGSNRRGIANELAHIIQEFGATILEGHMTVMSKEFAVIIEVTGPWNALAKLEHQLPLRAHQLGLLTMLKRTESLEENKQTTAYRVTISTVEDRGIIKRLTQFFSDNKINIDELNCRTYLAPHSEDLMGEVKLTVTMPDDFNVEEIRTKFEQFCLDENLSGIITPLKNSS